MEPYTFSIRIDGSCQRTHSHFGPLTTCRWHMHQSCNTPRQSYRMAMHADHVAGPVRLILLQTNIVSCRTTSSDMRLPSCCRLRLTTAAVGLDIPFHMLDKSKEMSILGCFAKLAASKENACQLSNSRRKSPTLTA